MKNLYTKLLLVQNSIKAIAKEETNPFFKSKYFDINTVIEVLRPIFNQHGIVVLQPLSELNGKPAIKTILAEPESGETLETITPLIENNDVQKFGGVITYTRRYALVSMFLIQGEDDTDGNDVASRQTSQNAPGSSVAPNTVQSTTQDVCKDCGAVKIMGKKGMYCKPCYIAYVEKKKATELPVIQQEAPEGEVNLQDIPF